MKMNLFVVVLLSGLALPFAGCQTGSDHGAYLPVNVSVNDLENRTALVLLDSRVQQSVTCPGIQETRLPDGRLQVAVNLRNRENRRIQVQVNCEFKDPQGFVIDTTPFQNVILDENAQEGARFVAMSAMVSRYTIRVRQAR
jgi:hypothetical protein